MLLLLHGTPAWQGADLNFSESQCSGCHHSVELAVSGGDVVVAALFSVFVMLDRSVRGFLVCCLPRASLSFVQSVGVLTCPTR